MISLFDPVTVLPVDALQHLLRASTPINYPASSRAKSYQQWRMEVDDSPIFRYIYRHFAPGRHLEYGTWRGEGTCYVLEECAATVWTLNLPFGERTDNGSAVYGAYPEELSDLKEWGTRLGCQASNWPQTDNIPFVGYKYILRGFGHRVAQIYTDSRQWDSSHYPNGFFDSCLIDGGHTPEIVVHDTMQALRLVRRGGLILWHDFCPDNEIVRDLASAKGVVEAIHQLSDLLTKFHSLHWIEPSFILLGIKN
jgi:Methyltransferase domain